jgi:hypothetical protein
VCVCVCVCVCVFVIITFGLTLGRRATRPKVFTDFAYGNDDIFNNLMRWLLVDEYNWYSKYQFVDDFVNGWNIRSGTIAPYNNESVLISTTVDGVLPAKQFVMDQYSCMSESNWLYKCVALLCPGAVCAALA